MGSVTRRRCRASAYAATQPHDNIREDRSLEAGESQRDQQPSFREGTSAPGRGGTPRAGASRAVRRAHRPRETVARQDGDQRPGEGHRRPAGRGREVRRNRSDQRTEDQIMATAAREVVRTDTGEAVSTAVVPFDMATYISDVKSTKHAAHQTALMAAYDAACASLIGP